MKNLKLRSHFLYTLLFAVFLISCDDSVKEKYPCGKFTVRNGTSEWSFGEIRDIDSVNMHSKNHITIYSNGVKQDIFADWIQVTKNQNCK